MKNPPPDYSTSSVDNDHSQDGTAKSLAGWRGSQELNYFPWRAARPELQTPKSQTLNSLMLRPRTAEEHGNRMNLQGPMETSALLRTCSHVLQQIQRSPVCRWSRSATQRVQRTYIVECRVSILGITIMIWGSIPHTST